MNDGLPFTALALDLDAPAIRACLTAGLIVLVNVNPKSDEISGILSAHSSVAQAFAAYEPLGESSNVAVIIPQEVGPAIYYSWLTLPEFQIAAAQ